MSKLLPRCPCCLLPSLGERGSYEICIVCRWEDDGQDDADASHVFGGPNGKYSLAAARANFSDHGDMYDRGQGIEAVERPTKARSALIEYARRVGDGIEPLDETKLEKLIRAAS